MIATRYATITAEDRGPLANILAWFLLVSVILSLLVRLVIKRMARSEGTGIDDGFVIISTVIFVIQVILTAESVEHGLGRHKLDLNLELRHALQKLQFANDILYFINLSASKCAVLYLLYRLGNSIVWFENAIIAHIVFILCWCLAGILVIAFQCGTVAVWSTDQAARCANMIDFWTVVSVLNILSELLIVALPIQLVWNLSLKSERKRAIICAFGLRLMVFAAIIAQIIVVNYSDNSSTQGLAGVNVASTIAQQGVLALSIITANAPLLKPFLDAFNSGAITATLRSGAPLNRKTDKSKEHSALKETFYRKTPAHVQSHSMVDDTEIWERVKSGVQQGDADYRSRRGLSMGQMLIEPVWI